MTSHMVTTPSEASAAIDVLWEVLLDVARARRNGLGLDVEGLLEDRIAALRVKRDELHAAEMARAGL